MSEKVEKLEKEIQRKKAELQVLRMKAATPPPSALYLISFPDRSRFSNEVTVDQINAVRKLGKGFKPFGVAYESAKNKGHTPLYFRNGYLTTMAWDDAERATLYTFSEKQVKEDKELVAGKTTIMKVTKDEPFIVAAAPTPTTEPEDPEEPQESSDA